jgi:hypothetical protein
MLVLSIHITAYSNRCEFKENVIYLRLPIVRIAVSVIGKRRKKRNGISNARLSHFLVISCYNIQHKGCVYKYDRPTCARWSGPSQDSLITSSCRWIDQSSKGEAEYVSLPFPVHYSLPFIKTPVPLRGGSHKLDTLRLQAKPVEDLGADWSLRGAVCRPTGVWKRPGTHQSNPQL